LDLPAIRDFLNFTGVEIILKGFIIGLVAAAPTGPSGVLCIKRSLGHGRKTGLATGVGVSFSDMIYVFCSSIGMSLVMMFIEDRRTFMAIKMAGCALVLIFGILTLRSNPIDKMDESSGGLAVPKGDKLVYSTLSGFLVAITNPLVVFIYLTLFAYLAFPIGELHGWQKALAYGSVYAGDFTWWFSLSYFVSRLRNRFTLRGLWMFNRVLGVLLVVASVLWFGYTLYDFI